MNKVAMTIAELHRSEGNLAKKLLQASDRHKVDHDIFYVGRELAGWSRDHMRELARVGRAYDLGLDPDRDDDATVVGLVRQKGAELLGRRTDPALLLLRDLRDIHVTAAGVSVDWEVLAQAAQALKDGDLLALATRCHPQTLRQLRWSNAALKENAPQIMASP
jgi:hypothetical protein